MSLNSGETLQPFKALNQLIFDSSGNLIGIQNDRAVGNDLRIGGGDGVDGTFATLIATTALKLNSGATFDLYNTADQTTNYERLRADWSGNVARIYTQAAGTGTVRGMSIATGTYAGTSGTTTALTVNPTISQSGTAGSTILNVDPTVSATGSGSYLAQRWGWNGTPIATLDSTGVLNVVSMRNSGSYGLGSSFGVSDVVVTRDAADTLALRRSTNAQTFRVYKTYTDASNYERLDVGWSGSQCFIGAAFAGTGAGRELQFVSYGSAAFTLTATAHMAISAGTTARSQINFASSTAPTSPADGDLWFDGTNLNLRVSGTTYTLTKV